MNYFPGPLQISTKLSPYLNNSSQLQNSLPKYSIATTRCIKEDKILEQIQTHQAESDKDDNNFDDKTVKDVASE